MVHYILRRIIILIPLLLAISFLSFILINSAPGDILAKYRNNPRYSEEMIQSLEKKYQFDKPLVIQYFYWLKNMVMLDFGYSFSKQAPVKTVIASYAFNTLILTVVSLLFSWLVALPLGIYCAVHHHKTPDIIISFLSYTGLAVPTFFLGILILFVASSLGELPLLGTIPLGGMKSNEYDSLSLIGKIGDIAKHLIIPAFIMIVYSLAENQRFMRGNMLEELRMKYITTARAKGLPEHRVIYIHALRNAINPLITLFGMSLSSLLAGAAFVEIITSWPGLGYIMLQAVITQDLFLIMANIMITGVLMIGGNLVADILLVLTDPRIRLS